MAFSLNAFSAGLGGLLQQMIAGQQQSQVMQQKLVDQQIPLFNQQRAWQKEAADSAFDAEKRKHDLAMLPLLLKMQQGQLAGQEIANNTASTNLGILTDTAPALKRAPGLANEQTETAITGAKNANDVSAATGKEAIRQAGLGQPRDVFHTDEELRKDILAQTTAITQGMAIMASPSATADQKRAAQSAVLAARQALSGLQSGLGRRYAAVGGGPMDQLNAAGMFPIDLMKAPLPKIKISPFNPAVKAVHGEFNEGLTKGVQTSDYEGGTYIKNGVFSAVGASPPVLQKAKALNRQLTAPAITRMFGMIEQAEADPKEYFSAYHGITLSPHELAVKRLTPENKAKLVESLSRTFVEPTELTGKVKDDYTNLLNTIADYYKTTTSAKTSAKGQVDAEKQKVIAGAIDAMKAGYGAQVKLALANMRTASEQISELEKAVTQTTGKAAGDILTLMDDQMNKYKGNTKAMIYAYRTAVDAKKEMDDAYATAFTKVPGIGKDGRTLDNNYGPLLTNIQAGNNHFAKIGNAFRTVNLSDWSGGTSESKPAPKKSNGKPNASPQSPASNSSSDEIGFGEN